MAIIRKQPAGATQTSAKKQIVKVNPYENPENVMELMSKICSATPSVDTELYWNTIREAYSKEFSGVSLDSYLTDNRANLLNKDFVHDLNEYCRQISWSLTTRENTEHTQVVVAGGFSSGKSSFLNRLTQCANLLPTGVEPVSVVKTYLYCSKNTKGVSVKGVNPKNVLVDLNSSVLQAIQHAKQSNVYLASVLDKLFVEIPSQDLDGLVFIDTPGYNNSDTANKSNGKTDRQTALEALGEGNVLFWLVDCERGTTVSADLDIIKQFDGKKVFIFNKADKKGEAECEKIVEQAAASLLKEFPHEEIIDILAFSTLDNRIYYSYNGMTLERIIQFVKRSGNGATEINLLKSNLESLFDDEIESSNVTIRNIESSYKEDQELRDKAREYYNNAKSYRIDIKKQLTDVCVNNYNQVMNAAEKLGDSSKQALDDFVEFYNGVMNFENNDHWGSSDILTRAMNKANSAYDRDCKRHNAAINYQYYYEDYRKNLVNEVDSEEETVVSRFKEWYDECEESCANAKSGIEREREIIRNMQNFKNYFLPAVDYGIRQFQQKNKATNVSNETEDVPNVFETIKKDDYKAFLHNFENGVDLSICNPEGYNPMTSAVQMGNNMMVKFLLDHDADPSIKDNRGYNAFHTAVENQYRDICNLLLDYDPDLIDETTSGGESVEDLANKQTFTKWIQSKL